MLCLGDLRQNCFGGKEMYSCYFLPFGCSICSLYRFCVHTAYCFPCTKAYQEDWEPDEKWTNVREYIIIIYAFCLWWMIQSCAAHFLPCFCILRLWDSLHLFLCHWAHLGLCVLLSCHHAEDVGVTLLIDPGAFSLSDLTLEGWGVLWAHSAPCQMFLVYRWFWRDR